jgi:hypothetical protein
MSKEKLLRKSGYRYTIVQMGPNSKIGQTDIISKEFHLNLNYSKYDDRFYTIQIPFTHILNSVYSTYPTALVSMAIEAIAPNCSSIYIPNYLANFKSSDDYGLADILDYFETKLPIDYEHSIADITSQFRVKIVAILVPNDVLIYQLRTMLSGCGLAAKSARKTEERTTDSE